jgi:hypothetical protein
MSGPLRQLTLTYDPTEDRMLLRIATAENTEYQLWLTRRFVKVLWGALMQTIDRNPEIAERATQPAVRDAVKAMQHQEAVQSSDFSKPHTEGNVNLTSNSGPLLVTGGQVKPVSPENTVLSMKTASGSGVQFGLNKKLLHALCHMMITSAQKADWELDLTVGDPRVLVPEGSGSVVH